VTAHRVPWTRRGSRGREEHKERSGPERWKDERRLEEHREPAENTDTDETVDEHEERPEPGQPPRADRVRSDLLLSCRRQQIFQCLSLREDLLELRLGNSKERAVLTRAETRIATAGVAGQQRLLADMAELLELRQNNFVTVAIDCEDFHRTADYNIGAVAGFAFPEDESRRVELGDLGDLSKFAKLASLEIAEQSQALEELFAFRRDHDSLRV